MARHLSAGCHRPMPNHNRKLQTLPSFSSSSPLSIEKPAAACARSKHCSTCSGDDGLSFSTLLQFAKDFLVCPEIISRQQLVEIFNSVLLDPVFVASSPSSCMPLMDTIDQRITFCQFMEFLIQISLRCPIFKECSTAVAKV
mmetsp:Transcript_7259/g.10046  ORF Transcript_7259/g.10046 Transcript_7259/m.10046 type:complete len:142 (+) Transcript_7259:547-972(+)